MSACTTSGCHYHSRWPTSGWWRNRSLATYNLSSRERALHTAAYPSRPERYMASYFRGCYSSNIVQDLCDSVRKKETIVWCSLLITKKKRIYTDAVAVHYTHHREDHRVYVHSVERHCYAIWIGRVTPVGTPPPITLIALEEHGTERTRTAIAAIRGSHDIYNEVVAYVIALASSRTSIRLVAHYIIAAITINFAYAHLRQPSSFHWKF